MTLTWSYHAGRDCLRVVGWLPAAPGAVAQLDPEALARRFAVVPASLVHAATEVSALQPLAGRFEVGGDALCFVPRWPFVAGLEYALLERSPSGAYGTVASLHRPAPEAAPTTEVLAIYPTAPRVPVNLLKIYVSFTAPMSEGHAARAVRVRRADTNAVLEDVFLPNSLELWDPARTRLTLLLDPGRIKRGLLPHQQMGYPLMEGVPVTVTVDPTFRDAASQPLCAPAERHYEVAPPLRTRIDSAAWQVHPPAAATRDALKITFDRPLDRALLDHALTVHGRAGAPVQGRTTVGTTEHTWHFVPLAEWDDGNYTLAIDPRLEDLAGNSLARVFDRDLTRDEDTPLDGYSVTIDFAIGKHRLPHEPGGAAQ